MKTSTVEAAVVRLPPGIGLVEFFLLFSKIGLSSFGGGPSVWMHRALVECRGWLSESRVGVGADHAGGKYCQPCGSDRPPIDGFAGAVVAVMGLLVGPSLVVIEGQGELPPDSGRR